MPRKKQPIELLTLRIEAMEMREFMLKERIAAFERDRAAMNELKEICIDLKSTMFIVFESICNFDDLMRPNSEGSLRSKRMQFFKKA